jgi:hypothetical protein
MLSTVKSRPSYYEMLGLTPHATGDAIAEAFARATSVFRPHAFGGITELCLAYETLRDPARRRAYDASLGLPPRPIAQPVSRAASAHFMQLPAVGAPSPSVPSSITQPQPRSVPGIEPAPEPPFEPLWRQSAWDALPGHDELHVGISPIVWKRTGVVVGGLVATAVFVGAIAGWWSGNSAAEAQPAARAVSATKERAPPAFSELWQEPAPRAVTERAVQPRGRGAAKRAIEHNARPAHRAATDAERLLIQPPADLASATTADPLAPETSTAAVVAAAMPLPHRTIASTIDRIGYHCGSVTSAAPIEGSAGAYKVTCASGQSFQAKPVKGRYRFRRLASN